MSFMLNVERLKDGLVIFRRADVGHAKWYCRVRVPNSPKYKTVRLNTPVVADAREKALEIEAETRFRIKHELPIFERTFSEVGEEFSKQEKARSEIGEITFHRWRVLDSHIKKNLNRYVGNMQITQIGEDRWKSYPTWRRNNGKGRTGGRVSAATIRVEMGAFRSVLLYAIRKRYIPASQAFQSALPLAKVQREEFTPPEYRKLHTFGRKWVKEAHDKQKAWYRAVAYNFVLIMANTGMRPSEARNLLWRDVAVQTDRVGRKFARLSVRGKNKHRNLVAANSVAGYFERIRDIAKAKEPDDFVFTNFKGKSTRTLYHSLIESLLKESGLTKSSSGSRRSTYCFRHTYATFRLTEGVDVYFLSKQMGTSVKMIEDHYGHVTPVKNADKILMGLPGWERIDRRAAESG